MAAHAAPYGRGPPGMPMGMPPRGVPGMGPPGMPGMMPPPPGILLIHMNYIYEKSHGYPIYLSIFKCLKKNLCFGRIKR